MSETPAVYDATNAALLEQVVVNGDLKSLSPAQRVDYYSRVCDSLGLNKLTKPFDYLYLNNKLTLYARKDATDQLRDKKKVSIYKLERERTDGIYLVTAYASTKDGRTDSSIGAVATEGLKGNDLANAMMKAETKAKRRVTLSICGLGWLDETELDSIPDAKPAPVLDDGSIPGEAPVAPQPPKPTRRQQMLDRIAELEAEARGLDIDCRPLAADAPDDYIAEYGKWLKGAIAQAKVVAK